MATEVDICNMALSRIGVGAYIVSLTENSAEASSCRILYPMVRDLLQSKYAWPFLIKRAPLAARVDSVTGKPVTQGQWAYSYNLPADCLRPVELTPAMRNPRADLRAPYAIESGDTGRLLLTDVKDPELVYVGQQTNPTMFPPTFVDALAWALAAELAITIPEKEAMENRCRARYTQALHAALATVGAEGQEEQEPDSKFIAVRD